jgi:hypothetical protein
VHQVRGGKPGECPLRAQVESGGLVVQPGAGGVRRRCRTDAEGYLLATGEHAMRAATVVVSTGPFQVPLIPPTSTFCDLS